MARVPSSSVAMPTRRPVVLLLLLLVVTAVVPGWRLVEAGDEGPRPPAKPGRCPPLIERSPSATDCARQPPRQDDCGGDDARCGGDAKCCYDGCHHMCVEPPIYSACEHQQLAARSRMLSDESSGELPHCTANGTFEPIQCNDMSGECWCVDNAGFEMPGTRASAKELVNCSAPRLCSGLTCRMLCPYDFELDEDGCPLCRCRDPCSGVRCPTGEECHLEEVLCDKEPCPPVPSCKQARHLDSICPFGEPLYLSEKTQPFLCGTDATQPQCPPFFTCLLQPNMDYGTCCPVFDNVEKPGKCPSPSASVDECGNQCGSDAECPGLTKCCASDTCDKHCIDSNSTACELQRTLVELLSRNEKAGRGYVPECTEIGEFRPKQCSRNGLVCWCVDIKGRKVPGTMGPAERVACSEDVEDRSGMTCDDVECRVFCEYGFRLDENKCQTCECADPCDGFSCPDGSRCVAVEDDDCDDDDSCPPIPACRLTSTSLKKVGVCPPKNESACEVAPSCSAGESCPGDLKCCLLDCGHRCIEPVSSPRLPTMCEYLRSYAEKVANTSTSNALAYAKPECNEDGMYEPVQCDGDGSVCWCVDEFGAEIPRTRVDRQRPQDCATAESRHQCLGLMCRLGCDYGFRKDEDGCPICECRNPCDGLDCGPGRQCHLVEVDEDCGGGYCPPVPQCLTVSKSALECPSYEPSDEMNNSTLLCGVEGYACPDTHFCLTDETAADLPGICCLRNDRLCSTPEDQKTCLDFKERWFYNNATGHCEVFGSCDGSYFVTPAQCEMVCAVNRNSTPKNGTCPPVEPDEMGICATECAKDADCRGPQKCCLNGCGAFVCREPKGSSGKRGQCPFLLPLHPETCELRCKSDYDCIDDLKCCSNGCGTKCVQPEMKTACEHQKSIAEFKAMEAGYPVGVTFAPQCREDDGGFAPVQCNLANQTCWCVDETGKELAGTRTYRGKLPDCGAPANCSPLECDIACPYGPELDVAGCPMCLCRDPCKDLACRANEECRLAQVKCVTEPCPPLPICLPKLDNPCLHGEPFADDATGSVLRCGPDGQQCPSTHQCRLSAFGEFAVCCTKPRDVCFQPVDAGQCVGKIPRWYFDPAKGTCNEFQYSSCSGNSNNFQTKEECENVCPPLSACERAREKSLWRKKVTGKEVFVPKCNMYTRDWEEVQCLPSVGVCWCVSRDGEVQPGTFARGQPQCTSRQGRKFTEGVSAVCGSNETVHVCPSDLCRNKVCLAYPEAACRINPCGGCEVEFYDDGGDRVDCDQGLSSCLSRMQHVLNSEAWSNQQQTSSSSPSGERDGSIVFSSPTLPESGKERAVKRDIFGFHLLVLGLLPSDDNAQARSPEALPSPADEEQFHAPPRMGVWLPLCDAHGGYMALQKAGPLGWCVDHDGGPVHRSLKRGRTDCDDSANVTDAEARLACPENSRIPRVCADECLNAYCAAHPDAVCWADPCNNCKITFTNGDGEPLNCDDKCLQSLERGTCKALIHRWFFNRTTERCEEFAYGGCQGNDNNFDSREQCRAECERPRDVCHQPKRVGMCRASMHRWFFNAVTHKCEEFIYGGCDGNDNNFETEEECQAVCPDLVLCPRFDANGELQQCSRVTVCHGKACLDRDDTVCTVDPCNNCSAYFVDLDGVPIECNTTTPEGPLTEKPEDSSEETVTHSITRCEKQRTWAELHGGHSPQCDDKGRFEPTQCEERTTDDDLETFCWCVDEAGNQVQGSFHFVKGTQLCEYKKITRIDVTLTFSQPSTEQMIRNETLVKEAVMHLLSSHTSLYPDDVAIEVQPQFIIVKFVLAGEDKVDVAYVLEEQIQLGRLVLAVADHELPAVHSASAFRHHLELFPGDATDDDDGHGISSASLIVVSLITLLAMILICSLIMGVLMYRRKRMGTYPKGSMESLASSTSPLYESKKIPRSVASLLHHFVGYESGKRVSSVESEYATIVSKGKLAKDAPM